MARRFTGGRLVVATRNPGKLQELRELLPAGVDLVPAGDLGLPEPEETGASFAENALIKARAAALGSGLPAGAVVCHVDGLPGVNSARWAEASGGYPAAMRRIHDELAARSGAFELADLGAHFACAVCLFWPEDGHHEGFEGRVDGELASPPRGSAGFGYDPIFVPAAGDGRTFAEMDAGDKHALSHRARAVRAMIAACFASPSVR